jgi:Carboxypeptidase regulatory-like domain
MTFDSPIKKILFFVFSSLFIAASSVSAQNASAPAPPSPREPQRYTVVSSGAGYNEEEEDETKVTGATVRGRVVYEDSNRPVRYALVMLSRGGADNYGRKYLRTDENGEFVFKNVKEGKYIPVVKGAGILNELEAKPRFVADGKEKESGESEALAVSGLGDFQVTVMAKRGGAITGRIFYADGEPAVGVKVQALQKQGGEFLPVSDSGSDITDDRGIYRIAGLPGGFYIVRVIEPVSHGPSKPEYDFNFRGPQSTAFTTFYPEGDTSKSAKELEITLGLEQSGVDISIPDRQRFVISGKIIRKRDSEPLGKFNVTYVNLSTAEVRVQDFASYGMAVGSNKAGEWSLRNLPKGKYRITVSQGYISSEEEKKKPEKYPVISKEIEITDKDITGLTFEIPTASVISGTIIVEGGKEITGYSRLVAVNVETGETKVAVDDYEEDDEKPGPKQRVFKLGEIKEGKYTLSMAGGDYFIRSVSGAGPGGGILEIKEGESITGLKVVVSGETGTVKGRVANAAAGDELFAVLMKPGTTVMTMPWNSKGVRVTATGEFEVKWAPGDYVLFVVSTKGRPTTEAEMKDWINKLIRDGSRVTIKAGEVTSATLTVQR